jgi:hypothetical protein
LEVRGCIWAGIKVPPSNKKNNAFNIGNLLYTGFLGF